MVTAPKCAGVVVDLGDVAKTTFETISAVRRALMQAGLPADVATEYTDKALRCGSYDELLRVTKETVEVT
jgi:hypothetical protein